ncbi:uncharacterized protein N7459_002766 [Penicillium hispanicum]|uniref:uncharacterized protein n=1 Tax=Penicillium hispanicum TaxID=1080232 RepID=UPI00254000ED|nr:uncharacterized protein N7459_002766 [Penicillium hispanicum]KAJ5587001.1 hypothetical protein N7459_002766 [Penicillium hispanicum]
MAPLHDALQCLKPTTWDAVPQSPEELREYVRDIFKKSRLVAESLPDPPAYEEVQTHSGEESHSARRIVPSAVRVGETDPEITSVQKEWGKPIKMGGPKDNPLGLHVWKLSSNDDGGSWFGRRSVHEGLSFARWRKKLSAEYDETLRANRKKIEKGQTPDKCIRGIGAEEKVETVEVADGDGSVMGQVMVYHVSAQFPKPTAPRDFVELIITSEAGLRIGGTKQPGRSWLMISKPCDHPDVPHKQGYTRGEYESVELIREIPRKNGDGSERTENSNKHDGSSADNSASPGASEDNGAVGDDEEMNPVEWIMVSRSDPGGNIPRWMVDKGTPRSVGVDAAKFVDWAIQDDKPEKQQNNSPVNGNDASQNQEVKSGESVDGEDYEESNSDSGSIESDLQSHHGLIASVTGLINTSLERFAPQAVLDYIPHQSPHRQVDDVIDESENDADGAVASNSNSAGTKNKHETGSLASREPDHVSLSIRSEGGNPSVEEVTQNNVPPEELMKMTKAGKLSSHEKELAKLALRKREIESKLDSVHSELDNLNIPSQSGPATPLKGAFDVDSDTSGMRKRAADNQASTPASSKTQQSQRGSNSSDGQPSSSATETAKPAPDPPAHVHKAASQLLNEESKLLKHLRKVESNQLKVASKIEARQRKEAERSEKSRSRSEVESLRSEVKDLKKEVSKLREDRQKWVDLVASLQAENTKLVARDGRGSN